MTYAKETSFHHTANATTGANTRYHYTMALRAQGLTASPRVQAAKRRWSDGFRFGGK